MNNQDLFIRDMPLAYSSIRNNMAITKNLLTNEIFYEQLVIPSNCTYWGMSDSLLELWEEISRKGFDPNEYCVFGPKHSLQNNGYCAGGDTQAGYGGKAQCDIKTSKIETPIVAARRESEEELRVSIFDLFSIKSIVKSKYKKKYVNTIIYQTRASNCEGLINYDINKYLTQSGKDDYTKRVGVIIWGTIRECFELLCSIESNQPNETRLVDDISGITMMPLITAISVANFGVSKLSGSIVENKNYPIVDQFL